MKSKKIHFVGIKGVGMAALAVVAKEAGCDVTGSDVPDEFITDVILTKAGIQVQSGFLKDRIKDVDLVITTGAHEGFDNPEVIEAKITSIPVLTQGEAVGRFMQGSILGRDDFEGISVAGCHGKTTTTAMIATILKESGMDPSFVIGTGDITSLGSSGHFGRGRFFVAEADEYATEPVHDKTPKFLWQKPKTLVITNIEFDHPDLYADIEEVRVAYEKFTSQLSDDGLLVACGDDHEVQKLLKGFTRRKITYGFSPENDYVIKDVRISAGQTFFWVEAYKADLGEFTLKVIGEHNALNALAASIVCLELGIAITQVKKGLLAFVGTKRRLEYKGKLASSTLVYDDYGHHPTEIEKTLQSVQKNYPNHRIVCIFQPHTYSRTKKLFNDFLHAFDTVDELVVMEIYASLREKVDETVNAQLLANAIGHYVKKVVYREKLDDVVQYIAENNYNSSTIIITMGAGDVYKIGEDIIKAYGK